MVDFPYESLSVLNPSHTITGILRTSTVSNNYFHYLMVIQSSKYHRSHKENTLKAPITFTRLHRFSVSLFDTESWIFVSILRNSWKTALKPLITFNKSFICFFFHVRPTFTKANKIKKISVPFTKEKYKQRIRQIWKDKHLRVVCSQSAVLYPH